MITAEFHQNTLRRYPDGNYGDFTIRKDGVLFGYISDYCSWVIKSVVKINKGLIPENTLSSPLIDCPECNGSGDIVSFSPLSDDSMIKTCELCDGEGKVRSN